MTIMDKWYESDLFRLLEDRRMESENRSIRIHERIDTLKEEINNDIEISSKKLMSEFKNTALVLERMDKRIAELERLRWVVLGGGVAVSLLLLGGVDVFKMIMVN
jgi:hypothetical protein